MKLLMIKLMVVSLLILVGSLSSAQTQSEMKAFITQANREMIDLIKAGKYESLGKYYDADAVSLPNYRAAESGYKLILNNNLGRQKGGYKILDGDKKTTQLITGEDMMVDIGTYTLTITFPGLAAPKVDNGKYLNVWKKDKEGNWKLVAETWNADKSPNAPATNPRVQGQPAVSPAPKPVDDPNAGKK